MVKDTNSKIATEAQLMYVTAKQIMLNEYALPNSKQKLIEGIIKPHLGDISVTGKSAVLAYVLVHALCYIFTHPEFKNKRKLEVKTDHLNFEDTRECDWKVAAEIRLLYVDTALKLDFSFTEEDWDENPFLRCVITRGFDYDPYTLEPKWFTQTTFDSDDGHEEIVEDFKASFDDLIKREKDYAVDETKLRQVSALVRSLWSEDERFGFLGGKKYDDGTEGFYTWLGDNLKNVVITNVT